MTTNSLDIDARRHENYVVWHDGHSAHITTAPSFDGAVKWAEEVETDADTLYDAFFGRLEGVASEMDDSDAEIDAYLLAHPGSWEALSRSGFAFNIEDRVRAAVAGSSPGPWPGSSLGDIVDLIVHCEHSREGRVEAIRAQCKDAQEADAVIAAVRPWL